ncbi:hypothetical protein ACFL10_00310 [Patescibacteria group bacterium]
MHDNHVYNLLEQLVTEQKSLWRIKDAYPKDSGGCAECEAAWNKLAANKEENIKELTALLKSHL